MNLGPNIGVASDFGLLLGRHGRAEGGLECTDIEKIGALTEWYLSRGEEALAPVLHGPVPAIDEFLRSLIETELGKVVGRGAVWFRPRRI